MKKEIIYCLKLGRKIKNENIKGVALETKIGQQKATCIVCDSSKPTFLKPITNKTNEKWKIKIIFADCKNKCQFIIQAVKNILIIYIQGN